MMTNVLNILTIWRICMKTVYIYRVMLRSTRLARGKKLCFLSMRSQTQLYFIIMKTHKNQRTHLQTLKVKWSELIAACVCVCVNDVRNIKTNGFRGKQSRLITNIRIQVVHQIPTMYMSILQFSTQVCANHHNHSNTYIYIYLLFFAFGLFIRRFGFVEFDAWKAL